MGNFIHNLFTTVDSDDFELSRVLWAVGVVAFIAYAGIALLVLHQAWSPSEYGIGFGAVLVGGGIGTAQKDRARAVTRAGC